MALTITIPGAVETTTGSTAPAVLTVGVGSPGVGVPSGGSTGQYLVKASATSYDTAWLTLPANYITSVTAPLAVTSGNLAVDLSAYLTTATAASTYQTIAGMSSYLTSATAASTYAVIAAGQPASGTVGQVLTKNSGTNYDSSWTTIVPGDRYLTTSTTSLSVTTGNKTLTVGTGLSYSSQQDVIIAYDAAHHMHALVTSYNSSTGVMVVDVQNKTGTGTYSAWTVNVGGTVPLQSVSWGEIIGTLGDQTDLATALNNKLETSTAATTYAALAGATFTGEVSTPASTTGTAGFSILPGTAPTSPTNGEFWNTGSDLQVRLGGVTETLAEQSWVTSQGYLTSSALTPYAPLAGATFTGLVTTVAASAAAAGLNIPHTATAPSSPVNGDIWSTTTALFARINGSTKQLMTLSDTQTVSGSITFSNASQTLGNSTATGTINVASGATISASTKTLNIGTGGVSGSTTTTILGPVLGASTTTIGATTAASTLNLATGATLTATTKAVNIGTAGVSGSTTTIAIGGTAGTSTTTMQGTTTFAGPITGAINNISLGSGTAAQVMDFATGVTATGLTKAVSIGTNGAAGSTTTIAIGGTAGTSTTTLNGTTNGVTAAADTNSVALATTAYVVGQAGTGTPIIDGTAAVGTSLRYARQDHVHPTDTSRAALASPTFTGTPLSTTAAVDTNTTQIATTAYVVGQGYAKLASPTFTGTPTLPTGTIGTTQSPGNNTTAVATTAFVTAAVPAFATETQAIVGTSSTTTISPLTLRNAMANAGYTAYTSLVGNYASYVSGSASVSTLWSNFVGLSVTAANGKIGFAPNSSGSYHPFTSRGKAELNLDATKPMWFSFRVNYSSASTIGDANTVHRVTIGKVSSVFGDLTTKGFGVSWTGGTTGAFTVCAHSGSAFTSVASAVTVSNTTYFPTTSSAADFLVYSDGTGNVTLFCNGVQVATTTGGPSSGNIIGPKFVLEADNTTSTSGTVVIDYTGIRSMYSY